MKIKFYPIDIDYKDAIRIFGKTEDGKKIVVIDDSLKPYFYAIPDENASEFKKKIDSLKESKDYIVKTELVRKKYLKEEVDAIKIYVNNQNTIPVVNDLVKELGIKKRIETDIPFPKKYLIEKEITPLTLCEVEGEQKNDPYLGLVIEGSVKQFSDDILKPKMIAFDIEVYSFSSIEDSTHPIISVSLFSENFKKVITWKKFDDAPDYVEFVKNESELLIKLKNIISEKNPDYLVGYYSDGFDLPYIMQRADRYGILFDIGIDGSAPRISRGINNTVKIKGMVHIDILQFIKKIMAGSLKLDSYSLDSVANELLKDGKKHIDIWRMAGMWDNEEIKTICEYNLHDSVLTYKVAEKILPNLHELVKVIGMPVFDVSRMSYGQLVENFLMKKSKELNNIVPNRPMHSDISERRNYTYQGAFVMEPKPGFYKNLVVFDFKSLYPSLIVVKNIDPSTLGDKGNKSPEIEGKNYYFDNKNEGFIPLVIKDLIERRNTIRELLKEEKNPILEARSYALKTVANAMYGYMGFFGARWYSKECVSSITAWARDYIKSLNKEAEKNNFNVIYNDTDSCCIELKEKTKEDAMNFLNNFNKTLPKPMELGLENFYPSAIFVSKKSGDSKGAKKKYAMIDEKDNIKISGFETVRRDWSKLARETQKEVLKIVLEKGDSKKAFEYALSVIKRLREKEVKLEELLIQTQLKMDISDYEQIGPHVAVARRMQEKGYPVSSGVPIWYIIVEGKGMIRDRARLPEECKEKEYDTEYYVNNQIIPAVEKILEVFGYKKEDLLKEKSQLKLGDF
ncbi:MAG: DNA-directed DNA polymerase [Nanoarchaeota archaeon]|nr:DNA-directed DNA polymerase [Nanoarchaeota archaeon]